MPATANKGYEIQTTGSNVNLWGQVLNDNMIAYVDLNLGGVLTKTLSNVTVNLTAAESRNGILRLIGTLSADVLVTTLNQGFQIVYNQTSGPFSVSFQRLGVGSPVIIQQNTAALITTDATNGTQTGADSKPEFNSGFRMPCFNTVAPTGWTALATNNNRGIQVVSAGGGVQGGRATFTDTFQTRGLTGTVTGTAITTAQMPAHRHFTLVDGGVGDPGSGGPGATTQVFRDFTGGSSTNHYTMQGSGSDASIGRTSQVGSSTAHDHGLSINNLNLNLAYVTCLEIQKN